MQTKPLISVLMPNYNGMPYLKEAVESVLKQTCKNFEFIIINDASTDGSWKYLKSLKDKRIRLLKNNKNSGLAASLNTALKVTKGDYVARMDADDISLPKRFETQLKFLESHSDVGLCGTWAEKISEKGKKVGVIKYPTSYKIIKKVLPYYNPVIHPSWLAKKEVYQRLQGYGVDYNGAEDYEFLLRARNLFRIANLPKILLKYRVSSTSQSKVMLKIIDRLDLKLKINILKGEGLNFLLILAILKKIIVIILRTPLRAK